jgi:hypothetical protein
MLKYLRIAVTALCLTACVLLCVLWLRSYRTFDCLHLRISSARLVGIGSVYGKCLATVYATHAEAPKTWLLAHGPASRGSLEYIEESSVTLYESGSLLWVGRSTTSDTIVLAPHLLLIILGAAVSVVPWLRWSKRFSLRTLLITTTLLAVGLGMIIGTS